MEYFPAASEDQWSYIKDLIASCDYYVVVLAGRYGSVDKDGVSFTEREYDFAQSCGIPTIAFTHGDPKTLPVSHAETNAKAIKRLEAFRSRVRKLLCKSWTSAHELGSVVISSLMQLIKRNPRPGWVRAGSLTPETSEEIIRLRRTIDEQAKELETLRLSPPKGSESLARGDEVFEIEFRSRYFNAALPYHAPLRLVDRIEFSRHTWDEIFAACAPNLIADERESKIKSGVQRLLNESDASRATPPAGYELSSITPTDRTMRTIKVQFGGLGYVDYWSTNVEGKLVRMCRLTKLGNQHLLSIAAISSKATRARSSRRPKLGTSRKS